MHQGVHPVSRVGYLKFDIEGAHRLIKKSERHWKFLVMALGEDYYCHTVGTFGEGSASYWFQRFYGAVHRCIYYMAHETSWGLVFADDSLWHLSLHDFWEEAGVLLLNWKFATLSLNILIF